MAATKPIESQALELLQHIAKHDENINRKVIEKLGFIAAKAGVAEMRHCQTNAQGTDAARMTTSCLKAESAL
eukprot:1409250-Pyramimonas_sp.AAC.1